MEEAELKRKRSGFFSIIISGLLKEANSKPSFIDCGECGIANVYFSGGQWRIAWITLRKIEEFI
jgi:hypothetical protein